MTDKTADNLELLRKEMERQGVDGFIVPRADEFQGEFVAPYAERLRWISGFSGSAGLAIILADKACLMTDGRYTLQAGQEVDTDLFTIEDVSKTGPAEWIAQNAGEGQVIGYDPCLHACAKIDELAEKLEASGITMNAVSPNPIDCVWQDQPQHPKARVEVFDEAVAGIGTRQKCADIAHSLAALPFDIAGFIITLPDSICWLLNVRGGDIPHTPVVLSYAYIHTESGAVEWFVDTDKVGEEVRDHLGRDIRVHEIADMEGVLKDHAVHAVEAGAFIGLDFNRSPERFRNLLGKEGADVRPVKDPCIDKKACKTQSEQEASRTAHLRDGVAVVRFLNWLERNDKGCGMRETEIADKLAVFRAQSDMFRDLSFPTICGFGPNGAIVHYRAREETCATLGPDSLVLIDSGAQYPDGTTDITRTLPTGKATPSFMRDYTYVLKGHLALSCAKFPEGTTGAQIDAMARAPLWQAGLDYLHGTGHGVGVYLSVHEEAANISPRGRDPLLPGMILSNEPGFYKEGSHGIRIENLVLVKETGDFLDDGRALLGFETLTLAPYARELIEISLLSRDEIGAINAYHARVYELLKDRLDEQVRHWLEQATRPL